MSKKIPAWLVLTVICVVAAALLAATNLATKDVIAANAQREAMETLGKLLPDAAAFETLEDSGISVGKDGSGSVIGYAAAAVTQGFGGEVETTVAARVDGTINGISVGGSNFAETAGLGARAKEPEFQAQFAGKRAPVALTKDGGRIEALSGATITSRAVVKGVNEAMEQIAAVAGFSMEGDAAGAGGKYSASAKGFAGPVRVFLTVDGNRTITEIRIGDSQFAETEGLGARAKEEAFLNQFIGKTIPVSAEEIDGITGATFTTNAVIEAIGTIAEMAQ
ncbi:MAG: FMN-binding protein [Clostridia bacterium]|nr:FMN-binding protein [Clostridia bacterium]